MKANQRFSFIRLQKNPNETTKTINAGKEKILAC